MNLLELLSFEFILLSKSLFHLLALFCSLHLDLNGNHFLEMLMRLFLGTSKETAVLRRLVDFSTARKNCHGESIQKILRHSTNVCLDIPPFIVSVPFVELIDYENLLAINLHAVSSACVEDEELSVRIGLSALLEV